MVLFFQNVYAQTYIGGFNSNTGIDEGNPFLGDSVWTEAGSPYILLGDITILAGSRLIIENNARIIGRSHNINIFGSIHIEGSVNQKVVLDSATTINLKNKISTSSIRFAHFKNQSEISINSENVSDSLSGLQIIDSFFDNSGLETFRNLIKTDLELIRCEFINGYVHKNRIFSGISDSIKFNFIDSEFRDTKILSGFRDFGGIQINNSDLKKSEIDVKQDGANITFNDCLIDSSKFVFLGSSSFLNIENSKVMNSSLYGMFGYLTISESEIINPASDTSLYHIRANNINAENSTFESNLTFNSAGINKLSGIQLISNSNINSRIENCTFKGYKDIITSIGNTQFEKVKGNYFLDFQGFAINNQSPNDVNAQENYWGTTELLQIPELIFDSLDTTSSSSLGIVDFYNFLSNPFSSDTLTKPENLFKGLSNDKVFLRWDKNKETEVSSYKIYSRASERKPFKLIDEVTDTTYISQNLPLNNQIIVSANISEPSDLYDSNESSASLYAKSFFEINLVSKNTLCGTDSLELMLDKNAEFSTVNFFLLELSDTTGSFENAITLDSINQNVTGFKTPLPSYIESGKTYSIRIKSTELELISETFSVTPIKFPKNTLTIANSSCRGDTINLSINEFSPSALITWELDSGFILENVGDTSFTVFFQSPGLKNTKLIIDDNGCVTDTSFSNNVLSTPSKPEICIVTVDETTNKNKIVWTHNSDLIKTYAIYRETNVADEFLLVDKVEANETLSYIDEQSFPDQISNRYKISAIDNCEYETALSNSHQTIHLTINKGLNNSWNLLWNQYQGFSFGTYKIYRGTNASNVELLTEVASNLNSYTDIDAPEGNIFYQIEVVQTEGCDTIRNNGRVNNVLSSKSNIARNAEITSIENPTFSDIEIFPNPTTSIITINNENLRNGRFKVFNSSGQEILKGKIERKISIDIAHEPDGVYIIVIQTDSGVIQQKVIKQ